MASTINEHCTTISDQRRTISPEQLKCLFDLIVLELNKSNHSIINDDYSKVINTFKSLCVSTFVDQSIITHELFSFIQIFLIDLLNKWSNENLPLTANDEYLFREIIDLFFKMIKYIKSRNEVLLSPLFETWFINERFFQTIASVLTDISTNSSKYVNDDQNMESIIMLIQSIQYFQNDNDQIRNHPNVLLLVDPMIKCLCSSVYIDTLKKTEIKSTKRSSFEEFLVETIPNYCVWNRGKAQLMIINQLCLNNMLNTYQEIYELFLSSIDDWEYSLMKSIFYITALLRYVAYYPSTREYFKENSKIIKSILIILNANCLLDNILTTTDYNSETNLTDSAISLIFNLTHDFQFLTLIKENAFFSKEIFLKLKHSEVDRVKLHAFMILAKILNEDDIQKLDHIDALISVFFDYLSEAVNDSDHAFQDVPIEHLLASLKAFVQHDEIKDEIAEQNKFELLIRCATQKDLHIGLVLQLSLEIIWTLIFNNKIHRILMIKYDHFIIYVKTILINSDEQGVQAAAKGILWKLENEAILKKQLSIKNENNKSDERYDLMISYSHSNKDLCFQIHQSLIKSKYRVWLDLENMYGSTLQSMAEAIELSDIILICMSNPYKQSAYCRSEAEYAFTRQRHIIPIVMEKKYRPDGWLGFICASKLYVDFTKTDFEQAFQKLISQIQLHQRQRTSISSSSTMKEETKQPLFHDDGTTSTEKIQENRMEQHPQLGEQERISSSENNYQSRYLEWWTHEDILAFLHDKHLDVMRPLFENEPQFDGQPLYILYQQCQANIESTYQLLNTQLTHHHDQILPYFTYLHFVSELRKQFNPIDIKQFIRHFFWNIWRKIHQKFCSKTSDG